MRREMSRRSAGDRHLQQQRLRQWPSYEAEHGHRDMTQEQY
jgi:hypothetical protein